MRLHRQAQERCPTCRAPSWGGTQISRIAADFTDYGPLSQSVLLIFKSLLSREEYTRNPFRRQVLRVRGRRFSSGGHTHSLGGRCFPDSGGFSLAQGGEGLTGHFRSSVIPGRRSPRPMLRKRAASPRLAARQKDSRIACFSGPLPRKTRDVCPPLENPRIRQGFVRPGDFVTWW